VLLAAGVEDAEFGAVGGDGQGRLPLVGGGSVVVDLDGGAPGGAAVGGPHHEDVGLVGAGPLVVVGDVDVAVDRVDGGVRELVAAEAGGGARPLADAGQAEVAVAAADQAAHHGHRGAEGQALVGGLAHLDGRGGPPEDVDGVVGA